MKLSGFRGLRLGGIDISFTNTGFPLQQRLTVCNCCDSCCPEMYLASCGHAFCDRCAVDSTSTDDEDDPLVLCVTCWKIVPVMKMSIEERFVAQLECVCPLCEIEIAIGQLRDHLANCLPANRGVPTESAGATPATSGRSSIAPTSQAPVNEHDTATFASSVSQGESQHILENRLNVLEERINRTDLPTLPVSYTLRLIYASGQLSSVYRTATVYLRNVGFYFATSTTCRDLNLWLALRNNSRRDLPAGPCFKLTVTNTTAVHPTEMSCSIRLDDMDVGDKFSLDAFFNDSKRDGVVLNVRLEDLD